MLTIPDWVVLRLSLLARVVIAVHWCRGLRCHLCFIISSGFFKFFLAKQWCKGFIVLFFYIFILLFTLLTGVYTQSLPCLRSQRWIGWLHFGDFHGRLWSWFRLSRWDKMVFHHAFTNLFSYYLWVLEPMCYPIVFHPLVAFSYERYLFFESVIDKTCFGF